MDLYHVWFDLKPGASDLEVCDAVRSYLGALREEGKIHGFRVTRRKLGLGPRELGEFHVTIETEGLAQLDAAFVAVSARTNPIEGLHAEVNQRVRNLAFALYRDFPDPQRKHGEERF
ncbi:MAG TPA: DUF6614 family protein [Myxococcota bacterium]|jgi:hypothetical protein|nr:DUF6614 family protein [Myxococcota bacterium]